MTAENETDNKEDSDLYFEEEEYIVPSKWVSVLLIIQIATIGFLLKQIGQTYAYNNNSVFFILEISTPLIISAILLFSWKKAKLKTNRVILKIVFFVFTGYVALNVLSDIAHALLNEILLRVFRGSGGWL